MAANHYFLLFCTAFAIQCTGGVKLYDVKREVCCGGAVHSLPSTNSTSHACCGAEVYEWRSGLCCNDRVLPFPSDRKGEYYNWGCCLHPATGRLQLYNFRTQLCCQGNVIDNGGRSDAGCCGNTTFRYDSEMCCDDVILKIEHGGQLGCCGQRTFNFSTHLCCSQWPNAINKTIAQLVADHIDEKLEFQLQKLPEENKFSHSCCGLQLFDIQTEVCCESVVKPRPLTSGAAYAGCCGPTPMTDHVTQICCDGQIVQRRSEREWCCGDRLFDTEKEVCCGTEVHLKTPDVSCCWEANAIYNPGRQVCCGHSLLDKGNATNNDVRCCY